ncbi:MAG: reductive dehalogenase [Cyclobacteriaceae bacterium]
MFSTKTISTNPKEYLTRKFEIKDGFEKFNQKNDIFNRSVWDDKVDPKNFLISYDITNYAPKKSKGFDHWDYAMRNASWHLTDVVGEMKFESEGRVEGFTDYYSIQTQGPPERVKLATEPETTARIKKAAKMFGAGDVGICEIDERWVYSHHFNRKSEDAPELKLPQGLKYAVMLIMPMDYELGKTFPAALSGATTGLGYSSSLNCANSLAQMIVNLGYQAVASLNDTAQSIPMAIQAGLGEYGRHGLLISKKFGPNVRIAKVLTDLPLLTDQSIEFGVKQFCEMCRKCSSACPAKAIATEAPQNEAPNFSSHNNITKWTVNAEKCFKFWVGSNSDCAICIRVCPYNKDYSKWWNKLGIRLANSPLRRFMLWLNDALKFGERVSPERWWNKS